MKNVFTWQFSVICLILSIIIVSTIYGTNPKLKEVVNISGINIKSYDESTNTAVIEYEISAKETFSGTLKISAPNSVSDFELQAMREGVNISKQSSEIHTVSVKLPDNEVSYISLNISVPTAPEGYKQEYYRYFKIIKSGSEVTILDPREESQLKPKEAGREITVITGTGPLGPESINYTVNISGRIIVDPLGGGIGKGLFGNGVILRFRNSGNPGTWYHPIPTNQLNVNYDLLDEQGNFNFNFSFTGDLSGYNQAIVIVNTANDAAYLPVPPDGYEIWGPHGYTHYFNESQGVIAAISGSSSNITVNQNGIINYEDGSILRYMQLAREFIIQRYGGNPPFTIPQIETYKSEIADAGVFTIDWDPLYGWYHYITIDPDWTEPTTITHEFGTLY